MASDCRSRFRSGFKPAFTDICGNSLRSLSNGTGTFAFAFIHVGLFISLDILDSDLERTWAVKDAKAAKRVLKPR